MKKLNLLIGMLLCFMVGFGQEYLILTSVESIVPAGIGRSRLIENKQVVESEAFETERTDGKKSEQGKVKRKKVKVDHFGETKLLNFYSVSGINFQNIASNDAVIGDRLSSLLSSGWELVFVTSGVDSGGVKGGNGIFITRYVLKKG